MKRLFVTTAAVAILAASAAGAFAVEQKDDLVQEKPPFELRFDSTSPGLSDSLTSAPTLDNSASQGSGITVSVQKILPPAEAE
jgi:hypothetical protein